VPETLKDKQLSCYVASFGERNQAEGKYQSHSHGNKGVVKYKHRHIAGSVSGYFNGEVVPKNNKQHSSKQECRSSIMFLSHSQYFHVPYLINSISGCMPGVIRAHSSGLILV
jgi:hypothetical protein